ncbi:MAG: hypothetical protein KDD36_04505 [Flavobacteriales bacterium]|nr:hypothetical protein [Flavobacteriales bacterium]
MARRKGILFLVAFAFTTHSFSQAPSYFPDVIDHKGNHVVLGDVGYQLSSNAITTQFGMAFINGEYIDSTLKDRVKDRLADANRLGGNFAGGLAYLQKDSLFGKAGLGGMIRAQYRVIANAGFTDGLFETVMYGNKSHAGNTVDMHRFSVNYFAFQSLSFGLAKNSGKSSFGINLSLLKGLQHMNANTERADFFTHADGEQIDLDLAMTYHESDTTAPDFFSVNGVGGSMDLFFEKRSEAGNIWRLEVGDLGMIRWVGGAAGSYDIDSLYEWKGWEVNDLFTLKDSIFDGAAETDSLVNAWKPDKEKGAYISWLPASIHLYHTKYLKKLEGTTMTLGLHYFNNANYLPYAYMGWEYKVDESFKAGARLAYGGYGQLQVGLAFGIDFGGGFIARVQSHQFLGHLSPKYATGQDLHFSLSKSF